MPHIASTGHLVSQPGKLWYTRAIFERTWLRGPQSSNEWKAVMPMATLEERVKTLEQEIAARKQAEEMLTIAVRALVSKEAFENSRRRSKHLTNKTASSSTCS